MTCPPREVKINPYNVIRAVIGLIFVVSGFEKVVTPYQNFQYVLQAYRIFPEFSEIFIAQVFPWIELITGIFLLLGLWLRYALMSSGAMLVGFLAIVGQAMIRKLPIDSCGCFGSLISLPLYGVFIMDSVLLTGTVLAYRNLPKTARWSLDSLFHD